MILRGELNLKDIHILAIDLFKKLNFENITEFVQCNICFI